MTTDLKTIAEEDLLRGESRLGARDKAAVA